MPRTYNLEPTPDEIEKAIALIRSSWTSHERQQRRAEACRPGPPDTRNALKVPRVKWRPAPKVYVLTYPPAIEYARTTPTPARCSVQPWE